MNTEAARREVRELHRKLMTLRALQPYWDDGDELDYEAYTQRLHELQASLMETLVG